MKHLGADKDAQGMNRDINNQQNPLPRNTNDDDYGSSLNWRAAQACSPLVRSNDSSLTVDKLMEER